MAIELASDKLWMNRCFDLARMGHGAVSPNPPVGAVLVHGGKHLSEGYHTHFGGPHAEVMAVRNVPEEKRHLIPDSTLYVSLEPCCVHGKTPPCTDLILRERIRDVRVSAIDPNPLVAGKGLALLEQHGVHTKHGILREEGQFLIRSFSTNILHHRPHVVLKWAQSKYGYTGMAGQQLWLSHPHTQLFSHKLRAHHDAILAGARTVETDNPYLTTREYPGRSPHRVIYDPQGRLEMHFHVFNDDGCTVYYFSKKENKNLSGPHIKKYILSASSDHASQMLTHLFENRIGNVIIEGGSFVHSLFIKENLWDEAWVIRTGNPMVNGIAAPIVRGELISKLVYGPDTIIGIKAKGIV